MTEHRAESKLCPQCQTTTKAAFPAGVRAPVQYGRGVLARSCYLHLYQLLPVARTAETMRDLFGCTLSPATVQRATRRPMRTRRQQTFDSRTRLGVSVAARCFVTREFGKLDDQFPIERI